ncbi:MULTISPECIES: HlyD family secretion protein [unclassified Polaribacter]|jgi:HlyD family secretion protein|uniref:HlyD family secretion protein n=1 Tax=unclassified Polaribacter TaxID=196858 RepID=UPI00052E2560|nr:MULTISPECIES: biotin/lipoyl-binding protein [unclassified Polaribacter]KGL59791.1 HlyD family secretion protein [Polaribacter sp. Hel1_33_49]MDG2436936.1 biotin/lipoyl-binding protein [Polaribacter sp.]PKV64289.1 HlyD family secretion protein [Polaribacter sp. Hel1_33_96]
MKLIRNLFIISLTVLTISACGNDEKISYNRGKVKFETISISGKLAGRVSKIYIKEGESVKKGDTLALLDIPEINAKMMQAEGAVTAATGLLNMASNGATLEQMDQINGKIDASKAQLKFAQKSYNRLQKMYADSLISLQQFDEVKMKRDMAKAQVSALEAKRNEVHKSARTEQLDQAKGQLKRAMGAKQEVLTAANEKLIIAPADMSIETISLQEGELLTPGYVLFNGYKKNSVFFRFTVPESKVYDFEVGKSLILTNPFTKEEVTTKIASIKQLAQYANITSTAPLYELSESIYELKVVPTSDISEQKFYLNATILIK